MGIDADASKIKLPKKIQRAYEAAKKSRLKAHAPYSKFKVGAALVTKSGRIVGGCNVENASYGAGICAERVAILKAVSEGDLDFTDFVVVTHAKTPAFPCALCLQMMAEFCEPETRVWVADPKKVRSVSTFGELLPKPFGPRQLKEAL